MNEYLFNKKHIIAGLFIKTIAIVSCIYGLIVGVDSWSDMTYFTNLSNIIITLAVIVSLIFDVIALATNGSKQLKNNLFFIIKFMFTLCISITFLIYMCILAPTSDDGFLLSYTHNHFGSLCLHFITPVFSIIDYIVFDYNYKSAPVHSFYALIPPLVYVAFIVILAMNGMRWGKYEMYAPYNFLNFGAPAGWFGFDLSNINSSTLGIGVAYMILVLMLIFWGIGLLFLFFKNLRRNAILKSNK